MARRIERALADGDAVQAQLEAVELARRELDAILAQMRREFARIEALIPGAEGAAEKARGRSRPRDAMPARRRTKH